MLDALLTDLANRFIDHTLNSFSLFGPLPSTIQSMQHSEILTMCDKLFTKYKDILNLNQSGKPIVQAEIEIWQLAIKMETRVREKESATKKFQWRS